MVLHKKIAILEQVRDFLLQPLAFLHQFTLTRLGTPAPQFRLLDGKLFSRLCHCPQNGLIQVLQNMELTNLMRQIAPDRSNGGWIQGGSVGRDPFYGQLPCL